MNKLKEHFFKDLYEMSSGISTKPEQAGHGYPFISFKTIFNNLILPKKLNDLMNTSISEREKYSIKKGDILLTRTSEKIDELAMSSVALQDYPNTTFSGFAKRLRPIQTDITYDRFMAFFLRSPYFRKIIDKKSVMTLRASFNEELFSQIKISIPEYSIQKKIGDLLYKIEEKIELNNKINSELEAMAKTIYDYWFLQFEFPNEEGKPYKSSGGKMVWNGQLKREIPEGWEVETLLKNRLSSFIKTGVEYFEEKNYLATANIVNEEISDGNWITYENRENRANMTPMPNSIWFAKMKNSIKHLTLTNSVGWFLEKYILSTGFIGIKCKENTLGYLHCFINSQYFELKKDSLAHGATQEAVNNEDLNSIKLLIPSYNILNSFNKRIVPLLQKKIDNVKENQELTSLRDFLLPLLMNGQVGFKE